MSLELAAQHLASRGRGPDTQLVHMAPQEVAGLQALAMSAGGSLTINPETGLAEAGFLKKLLPTIIGAGLAATGIGAPMAAMIVGGGTALASGSLQKGLMAGLGAYGGAGLATGLMGAGADAAAAAGLAGAEMAPQTAAQLGAGFESAMAAQGIAPAAQAAQAAQVAQAGMQAVPGVSGLQVTGALPPAPAIQAAQGVQMAAPQTVTAMPDALAQQVANNEAMARAALDAKDAYSQLGAFDKLSGGIKALGQEGGLSSAINAMGGGSKAIQYGLAGLGPAVMEAMTPKMEEYKGSGPNPYDFAFDWERPQDPYSSSSREAMQLRGRLRPITTMADGGPVSQMSERNEMLTLMANDGRMYAEGGRTDSAKGMTGASADAMRYLMGETDVSPATQAARKQAAMTQTPAPTTVAAPSMSKDEATIRGMFSNVKPFNLMTNMLADRFYGRQAAGSMEEDPNQPYNFSFNPATGQMVAAPRAMRPVTVMPDMGGYAGGGLAALAAGGNSDLGDYSDGGRLLKGPGDGVSDSIPATIGDKRPARLADGEFVIPARVVSELGNGSTDAGARKLYAMMDRIQKARGKTTGKGRVAVDSRADKALPA